MNKYLMQRGWMDMPIFADEPFTEREAFSWMIETAVWQNERKRCGNVIVSLKRGQLAYSERFLAKKWGWHSSKVHRFLNRLKIEALIETDSKQLINVITICQYNELQDFDGEYKPQTEAASEAGAKQERSRSEANKNTLNTLNTSITPEETLSSPEPEIQPKPKNENDSQELKSAFDDWNSLAAECGLTVVQKITNQRKIKLRARLRDCGGIAGWQSALSKIRGSPFLLGNNDRSWKADFDWVVTDSKFTQIMEGKYDDRGNGNGNSGYRQPATNGFTQLLRGAAIGS